MALWRSALTRLLRTPGWALLLAVSLTLLVSSVVAPPLFVDTARSTALSSGLAAATGTPYGAESADLRVTWDAVLRRDDQAAVLDRLASVTGYGAPALGASGVSEGISTHAVAVADGLTTASVLWYRDGAIEALGGDPDADGVWLSADVARELGLRVGDPVRMGIERSTFGDQLTAAPTVLLGTYEPSARSSLPRVLAEQPDARRWYLPTDPQLPGHELPLAITGRATFGRLALAIGEQPLYLADQLIDPGITPDEATTAVAEVAAVGRDAFDPSSPLNQQLSAARPDGAEASVVTGLPAIVQSADDTAASGRQQIGPYAVGGRVLAALLLVAAWVLLSLSRSREQALATGLGMHPVERALLAVVETLPLALIAVPLGLGLARLGVASAGPSYGSVPIDSQDVLRAVVAAGTGLLLVALSAGLAAAATDRLDRVSRLGRRRRALPWTVALVTATAVAAVAVASLDVGDRTGSPLTTVFPFLVATTVGLVAVRLIAAVRGRWPARARPGSPRWLAARRGGPVVGEVIALAVVVAVALGLFAYTLTVRRGIDEGVADKTAALAGARTTIEVAEDFRGHGTAGAVEPPVAGTTIVWRRGAPMPPAFGDVPVMGIDPESFAAVADWGGSGDLDDGRELLPRLSEKAHGLPVILAGDTDLVAGDQATLEVGSDGVVPIEVVGVLDAFPGSETEPGTVAVVADTERLFRLVPRPIDPRRKHARSDDVNAFASVLWSDRSLVDLRAALDDADVATDGETATATAARIDHGLVASTWAAAYVLALGVVALVLALVAGFVLVLRLSDRDAGSDVLLRRMGYSTDSLARARTWEVGYAVSASVVAAVIATGVLVVGPTTIDAAAGIPPLTRPRPEAIDVLWLLAVLTFVVLGSWLVGTVLVRRRNPAEVLRAGD